MERRRKYKSHKSPQDSDHRCRIKIFNRQTNLPIKRSSVIEAVNFFLQEKNVDCQEIAIYFIGKRKSSQLHSQFFNDPTPTDCMTFPLDADFLGEIFICPQVAKEANPRAPYEETTLYIFHSLLHLLGYDDIDKKKRARMKREENRLLALARKNTCILESSS